MVPVMADTLTLSYVRLDELVEAPRNPKRHSIPELQASLGRFGYVNPVIREENSRRLVAGHGRLEALRDLHALGVEPPRRIQVETDGMWLVPVVDGFDADTEPDELAYLMADNRLAEVGGIDSTELLELLTELDASTVLTGTGYDAEFLASLTATPIPAKTDPDAAPPLPDPDATITQPGDMWQLGPHRLLCADCTDPTAIARLHDGTPPDMTLTDPPYCSGGFQESAKSGGSVGTNATHKQIANDRLSTRGYMALMKAALTLAGTPYAYLFTDWRMWVNLFDVVESTGYGVRSMIVWDKGTPGMGRGWRAQHELIMWAAKQTPPFDRKSSAAGNVIQATRTGNLLHTTQKPVELLTTLLTNTPFAKTIYDPFTGSGSTLIAAHTTNRTCHGLELDPAYCDVTARRWHQHTGITPTRNGKPQPMTPNAP